MKWSKQHKRIFNAGKERCLDIRDASCQGTVEYRNERSERGYAAKGLDSDLSYEALDERGDTFGGNPSAFAAARKGQGVIPLAGVKGRGAPSHSGAGMQTEHHHFLH